MPPEPAFDPANEAELVQRFWFKVWGVLLRAQEHVYICVLMISFFVGIGLLLVLYNSHLCIYTPIIHHQNHHHHHHHLLHPHHRHNLIHGVYHVQYNAGQYVPTCSIHPTQGRSLYLSV